MYIIQVYIRVKQECLDSFIAATRANAEASRRERGVERYEFLQVVGDPTKYSVFEVYRSQEDHAAHRETAHYMLWRETVAEMMAEPRTAVKYSEL
jgi:autoinducer 2-degrading protein